MISTLVVILIVATFLLGCLAVVEDIDRQCERAQLYLHDDAADLAEAFDSISPWQVED